ncbi:MAG: hypothetical protein JSS49_13470 [Planctomycetes bacterium]|nr:hypothetical protein [Planctomycetota bacterium]
MMEKSTSEILAAIRSGQNSTRPAQLTIHGTGSSENGWAIRQTQTNTYYEKTITTIDELQIQRELTEFWRKLAIEVGASCAGKPWNVLAVDATLDYGSIGGSATTFTDRAARTFDTTTTPCRASVSLFIPHWESLWYDLEDENESDWEKAAAALESSVYDQIQIAATQEPARSALDELRKKSQFEIWVQPHDSPESGRFIETQPNP